MNYIFFTHQCLSLNCICSKVLSLSGVRTVHAFVLISTNKCLITTMVDVDEYKVFPISAALSVKLQAKSPHLLIGFHSINIQNDFQNLNWIT